MPRPTASQVTLTVAAVAAGYFMYREIQKKRKSTAELLANLPICEVVFVLGGPGAGKGTQCQLLSERLEGWSHLSAGDLLRAERKAGGELGNLINEKIASGQLVPSSITCKLLEKVRAYYFLFRYKFIFHLRQF